MGFLPLPVTSNIGVLFWPNKIQDIPNLEQDVFPKLQLPKDFTSGPISP